MTTSTFIRPMTADDVEEVCALFAQIFVRETLAQHVHAQPVHLVPLGKSACIMGVQSGLANVSVLRQGNEDKIIAFCIAVPFGTPLDDSTSPPQILMLMETMIREWAELHTEMTWEDMRNQVVYAFGGGTREEYQGRGELRRLMLALEKVAKEKGKKLLVGVATAAGSQKVCDSLGWIVKVEKKYSEIEYEGEKVFEGIKGPKTIRTCEKNLYTCNL